MHNFPTVYAWTLVGLWVGTATAASDNPVQHPGGPLADRTALRRQVDPVIERGLDYLKSVQLPDGAWRGFGRSDPAITALVAKCFAQAPNFGPNHPITVRAHDLVLRFRQADGGIYPPGGGLRNYYTSVALMALTGSRDPRAAAAVADAQRFLARLQWDENEGYASNDVFYGGAGYGRHKRPDLSNTQMMLEALHDSGLNPEHPVYRKALVFISRCQMAPSTNDLAFAAHGDGGFIYAPANGGESKAGADSRDGHTVLRSYGSMTYAGLKSMLYAEVDRSDPRVQQAVEWIRQHWTLRSNPNMPAAQATEGLYYYYHVFARAMAVWGEDVFLDHRGQPHAWRTELVAALAARQRPDGSWVNAASRWEESNPHLVTAYAILALQTARD